MDVPQQIEPTRVFPSSSLRRRLAASLYELLPVAAIMILVGGLFVGVAQMIGVGSNRLDRGARVALFFAWYAALGVYFVWCWRAGQTLPMKAWRLRVTGGNARQASIRVLVARFVLASVAWGLAIGSLLWLREHPRSITAWAALAPLVMSLGWCFFDRDRRSLYDRLANTRLVVEPRV